ncbi:substrate-binding periplasmic protein [Pseudoalteromonas sp. T1lg65]|uniref:substrate-binding periplasmic protein n=1 Tax=Pseudoalteromonas sp. T1lg65 TaxID=2077101 RepID=UPI003F7AB4D5
MAITDKLMTRILFLLFIVYSSLTYGRVVKLVTLEYPPYEFQGAQDASGIAVELVREAFNRIEQPFTIQFMPWGRAIREIKTGRVDGIFTIYRTPSREEFMVFSDEVLIQQSISIFARKSNQIEFGGRVESLSSYRIGVVRKVSYGAELDEAINTGLFENIVTTDSGMNSFKLLLADRVDIVLSNRLGGMEIIKQLGIENEVYRVPSYAYDIPSYIAFSKQRPSHNLKQQVDAALRQMKEDGTYEKIILEYLKHYNNEKSIYDTSPLPGKKVEERT